jgi:opacity protein-like surface antigen
MRPRTKLILGAAAAVSISTAASAADPMMAPGAPPMSAPAFDWSGPYVGAIAGLHNEAGTSYQYGGVQFGYNFVLRDRILVGLEVETIHWKFPGWPFVSAALNGRLGFIAGDRVLLYAEAGIGTYFFTGTGVITAGGGVEVAVTNALSVFGEVNREFFFGGGGLVPVPFTNFELGINYHPGGSAMMASSGGAFDGLYFGAFGGYFVGPGFPEFGVQFGYNHTLGNRFVAGTEIETYYSPGLGAFVSASLNGRLGATFGNFLAYGEAGIGTWIGTPLWSAGGGIEFAIGGGPVSAFAEATAQFLLGGGGYFGTRVDGGVNIAVGN